MDIVLVSGMIAAVYRDGEDDCINLNELQMIAGKLVITASPNGFLGDKSTSTTGDIHINENTILSRYIESGEPDFERWRLIVPGTILCRTNPEKMVPVLPHMLAQFTLDEVVAALTKAFFLHKPRWKFYDLVALQKQYFGGGSESPQPVVAPQAVLIEEQSSEYSYQTHRIVGSSIDKLCDVLQRRYKTKGVVLGNSPRKVGFIASCTVPMDIVLELSGDLLLKFPENIQGVQKIDVTKGSDGAVQSVYIHYDPNYREYIHSIRETIYSYIRASLPKKSGKHCIWFYHTDPKTAHTHCTAWRLGQHETGGRTVPFSHDLLITKLR